MNHHRDQRCCRRCGARLARDNPNRRCAACQRTGRDELLSPPAVPPTFWDAPVMRDVFARRHMGHVIRAFRLHPLHGRDVIPQRTVAEWVGLTQAQLSRIETGAPIVHLDRLIQWAQLLRIPEAYLWFKLPEPPNGVVLPQPEAVERDRQEESDVRRHDFLQFGGLAVASVVMPGLLKPHPAGVVTERDCVQWLAWELWRTKEASLHVTELPLSMARHLRLVDRTGHLTTQLSSISPDGLILCDQDGYCSLRHPSLIDFYVAQHIFRSVADGQSQLLATAQTSHVTDCVLQEFVRRHEPSVSLLAEWMNHGNDAVLRVNSAGILAKLDEPAIADRVTNTLKADQDNRQLYLTAVASRVLSLQWQMAAQLVTVVERCRSGTGLALTAVQLADLAAELTNPRDYAARWCSAVLLGSVHDTLPDSIRAALGQALRDEPCRENLRAIGTVLSGRKPLDL